MKQTDIERVIKYGSVKEKIKLNFIDVAYFNTTGIETAETNGDATLITKDSILTDKERAIIFSSVKEPKDIKYWEQLRTFNKAFLMFKPYITYYAKNFDYLTAQITKCTMARLLHKSYNETINDILEVVEEKKLRETLVKKALESLGEFSAIKYQEKGFLPFIIIPDAHTDGTIWKRIEDLNDQIKDAKRYINTINAFLKKLLPLTPYKQFVKKEEDNIKANVEQCRVNIEHYILDRNINTTVEDWERFTILRWEDVEVEVTDEDIEDIKSAGV